jgi:dihydrofolate reductase
MLTLAITQNITVDGSIEMLGSWFDPQRQGDMTDLVAEIRRQDETADAFLCGRRTFLDLRGYWRDLADDPSGVADYLNRVDKYVVSRTLADPEWAGTTVLASGDPVHEVGALKAAAGGDIVLTGSIRLGHTLIEAGLVDEYRLFVYPVVQGAGRRLFPDHHPVPALELRSCTRFVSGVALLVYAAR